VEREERGGVLLCCALFCSFGGKQGEEVGCWVSLRASGKDDPREQCRQLPLATGDRLLFALNKDGGP